MKIRTTQITVVPDGQPIFDELATIITIEDEAAGEFVSARNCGGSISIGVGEWPKIREAIDMMIGFCEVDK